MDAAELQRLIRDTESDRCERTRSLTDTDKFAEAICAFANDRPRHKQPGYLFVGAHPDGTATGAEITDQILQNLAAIRSEGHIQPLPVMNVEKWNLGTGDLAVVEVFPSDLPPVRYKGRIYLRVGPRRAIASEADERVLSERRVALARTWDARPHPLASLGDLALDIFALSYRPMAVAREVIAENERSIEAQLAALRLLDPATSRPTNAAVLLFGKDPVALVPGAYVQYVRYRGLSAADEPIRERRISGDLLTVMRALDQLAQELAGERPERLASLSERIVAAYPAIALHELLMNAVIHRNYDGSTTPILLSEFEDRIEIQSPGGLFGDLTLRDFPMLTSYRNPILAEAAKVLGFVNRFGRGIALAQAQLARNGSPPARFDVEGNHFLAVVRAHE